MIALSIAAWCALSVGVALLIGRAIRSSRDEIFEINSPSSDRQHFADQRLERRGFGEGAGANSHE